MSAPERPPGSHRRTDSSNRLAVLIASVIAIAIVAVAVTITLNNRGEPARKNAPLASGSTLNKKSPVSSSPSPTLSSPSSPSVSPSTSPPQTLPPSPAGSSSSPAPRTSSAPLPALEVLNDSRITGLAAQASATFRAAGWDVAATGNFHGADVPETTIFYPDGDKAAADRLAAQFSIHRLLPAPSELSQAHLTVALARDWEQRG